MERVAALRNLDGVTVRRNDLVDPVETGGIAVAAADPALAPDAWRRGCAAGASSTPPPRATRRWCSAPARPTQLGIDDTGSRVFLGGRWFSVIGILEPVTLASALDSTALVGFDAAVRWLGAERDASTVYVRAAPDAIEAGARDLLGPTANPERPEEVEVSRPSDALAAQGRGEDGVHVALPRARRRRAARRRRRDRERHGHLGARAPVARSGLRRALGATRRHVGAQFACESLLLAAAGGVAGVALGALVTAGYAESRGWSVVVPPRALAGGAAAAVRHRRGRGRLPRAPRGAALADGRAARGLTAGAAATPGCGRGNDRGSVRPAPAGQAPVSPP